MDKPIAKQYQIVIYDDEPERARGWKESLTALGLPLAIRVPENAEIQAELNELHARRIAADAEKAPYDSPCTLDSIDVLVVDYDLRFLEDHKGFATGEEIAYAARLFSKAKIIVVVNHPDIGLNDFDLNLQRDRNLKADVYIGDAQIANPGLWRCDPEHDGFLPWCWPVLLEDVDHFDQCVVQVRDHWNDNILSYFGLNSEETKPSKDMLSFIGMPTDGMTFEEVYGDPGDKRTRPFVRPRDIDALISDPERRSRVMAAVLKKWFRRWIVPAQTILADAPHLAATMPWGLNDYQNTDNWLELPIKGRCDDVSKLSEVFKPAVQEQTFKFVEWVGRPTFFSQKVRSSLEKEGIALKTFDFSKLPQLLFAEDMSCFLPVADAMEYDLSLDGQAQVRAISKSDYVPKSGVVRFDRRLVVYVPQSLLA